MYAYMVERRLAVNATNLRDVLLLDREQAAKANALFLEEAKRLMKSNVWIYNTAPDGQFNMVQSDDGLWYEYMLLFDQSPLCMKLELKRAISPPPIAAVQRFNSVCTKLLGVAATAHSEDVFVATASSDVKRIVPMWAAGETDQMAPARNAIRIIVSQRVEVGKCPDCGDPISALQQHHYAWPGGKCYDRLNPKLDMDRMSAVDFTYSADEIHAWHIELMSIGVVPVFDSEHLRAFSRWHQRCYYPSEIVYLMGVFKHLSGDELEYDGMSFGQFVISSLGEDNVRSIVEATAVSR